MSVKMLSSNLGKKILSGNKLENSTMQFHKSNKKPITLKEADAMVKRIQAIADAKGDDIKIMVRGLAPNGYPTLKQYNEDKIDVQRYEEYLSGKAKDTSKFQSFYQLQITVQRQI